MGLITALLLLTLQSSNVETLHRTVQVDGAPYDAMLTQPSTPGKHPAIFIIAGLGCYSLADLKPDDTFTALIDGLTQRGFVTMRVDKSGEGKSGGPPCTSPQSDLQLAVRRSVAGLEALATYDFVDRNNIFIFAHSIGPLEGVQVAQKLSFSPRGFLAIETVGKTWMEYTLENARRQLPLLDMPFDKADQYVRLTELCQHRFLIEKRTPEQVVQEKPECKDHVNYPASYTYMQQIADLNLAVEWKKVDLPVLVTYGTSDPTTSADEGHFLVTIINSFHPGRAEYMEFPGMGHGLDLVPSPRAWLENIRKHEHGKFDGEFLEQITGWMKKKMSDAGLERSDSK
jgi:alpha-beta hydrolase superfamily lysophospholipase